MRKRKNRDVQWNPRQMLPKGKPRYIAALPSFYEVMKWDPGDIDKIQYHSQWGDRQIRVICWFKNGAFCTVATFKEHFDL